MDDNLIKRTVLFVVMLTSFLTAFTGSSINIALPTIGKEFAMNAVLLSWVVTVYPLATAAFLVPFGRIADIYGRRRIFIYGILVYTLASLLSAISISSVMLISFRILQGIGAAMLFATGVAILSSVFPPSERGKALGLYAATVYVGLSVGPFLGGLLTQHFGWRSIFLVNVPLGIIIITFCFWKLKGDWAEAKGDKFDLRGSIIYSLALLAIIYGLSLLPAISGIWITITGILGGLAFIKLETRVSSPVLNINLFRNNKVFTLSNIAALINYSATFAVGFLLSLYLQYIKGFGPQDAGLILISMPAVQAILSPLAGRLSDKIEPRILASSGMGLTTIGLGLLTFLGKDTALVFILVCLVILGIGFALFASPNTNAVMSSVDKRFYGVASATIATMRQIGFTLSMGIAMLVFTIYIGRVEITPEYYPSFLVSVKMAYIVFTALCFVGIFASLARGKVK